MRRAIALVALVLVVALGACSDDEEVSLELTHLPAGWEIASGGLKVGALSMTEPARDADASASAQRGDASFSVAVWLGGDPIADVAGATQGWVAWSDADGNDFVAVTRGATDAEVDALVDGVRLRD